jgi:poly(A) polymerase
VTEEFVRRVLRHRKFGPSVVDNAGGRVFPFGSYALGVYGPGSDIDTLLVAPNHVSMDDFFDFFPDILREMSSADDIEELHLVRDAYVPLIKLRFSGVDLDLLFVTLPSRSSINEDFNLSDKSVLRGLDDSAMRSVNGTRVAKDIIENVPQVKVFRHATRAIKLWANRKYELSVTQQWLM